MWLLNDFVTKFILQSLYLFIFYSRPSVVVVLGVQGLISRFWFRNSWDALLALSTALSWHLPSTVPQGTWYEFTSTGSKMERMRCYR